MTLQTVVGLLSLLLSVFALAIVLRFWWRHRAATFARSWWLMAFAFGLFVVSETLGTVFLLNGRSEEVAFSLTIRVLFLVTLIGGLYRLFEDVLEGQQRALAEAQRIIELQTETVRSAQETEVLARVSESLTSSLDLETVLQGLCEHARVLSGADSASVRLPAEREGGSRFAVDFASAFKERPDRLDPQIDALCLKVVQAGRPAIVEDARAHPMFGPESPAWLGAVAAFPLRRGAEVMGTLTVVFDQPRTFSPETRRLLAALADHAAVAVRNAQLHEMLEISARTDALTGLANRRNFNETLTVEVRRARRYKMPLTLLMTDVVGLKRINDQHGHLAGDAALCAAAQVLRNAVRGTDLPARFGGDEFAVILPETPLEAARAIAERIRQETSNLAFDWHGQLIPVRLAVGVGGGVGETLPEAAALITAADGDLYRSRGNERPHDPGR